MRAALIAKRLCLKLRGYSGSAYTHELEEASDVYEEWAMGVLDMIVQSDSAVDHLINVSVRPAVSDRTRLHRMWDDSVMDEAMKTPYPCRAFLGHRHCQHLVDKYFTGDYPGSPAKVNDDTTALMLLCQVWHGYRRGPACKRQCLEMACPLSVKYSAITQRALGSGERYLLRLLAFLRKKLAFQAGRKTLLPEH